MGKKRTPPPPMTTSRSNMFSRAYLLRQQARRRGFMGNRLAILRHERGLSLSAVAREIGVTPMTVLNWERGAEPRGEHMVALCRFYNCEPSVLWPHLGR